MPDMTPVGTMYPPVNPVSQLSSILGVKQQQQALQTGQYAQATAQAESQQAQQKNAELQAVGNLTKQAYSSGRYKAADGSFDNQKFADDVAQVAPTYGQAIAKDATMRAGELYQNQQTLFNLDASKQQKVADFYAAQAADPKVTHDKVISGLDNLVDQIPEIKRVALSSAAALPNTSDPDALRQALRNMAIAAKSPAADQTNPAIGTYQGKNGIQPYQQNPQAIGGVKNVGAPLGPQGYAPTPTQMPNGSIYTTGSGFGYPGAGGGKGGPQQQGPRTAVQDAPPPNAPKAVQDAYQGAVQKANSHVEDVRTADESYGNNTAIANAIRQLSKGADTGPGTSTWNHVMGFLGTDKANNAQELGAFLDRQAATVRGQMGLPGTNAGAEDSKSIVGNTGYNAKVIQDKNDYTQALIEGLHQYRNGLDRVAGFSGQASPSAINAYKSAWAQNFDPNVYKGELAYKRSKAEGDAFVKSLPPQEAQSLAAKRAALQALSKGQLPQ